jgi:hypothetical protein
MYLILTGILFLFTVGQSIYKLGRNGGPKQQIFFYVLNISSSVIAEELLGFAS